MGLQTSLHDVSSNFVPDISKVAQQSNAAIQGLYFIFVVYLVLNGNFSSQITVLNWESSLQDTQSSLQTRKINIIKIFETNIFLNFHYEWVSHVQKCSNSLYESRLSNAL